MLRRRRNRRVLYEDPISPNSDDEEFLFGNENHFWITNDLFKHIGRSRICVLREHYLDLFATTRTRDPKDIYSTPLHLAATKRKHVQTVEDLLKSPNIDKNARNRFGETTLLLSLKENIDESIIDLLITYDCDCNVGCFRGITPLHVAALDNKINVLLKLLKKGVDVNAVSNVGVTPLHLAVLASNYEIKIKTAGRLSIQHLLLWMGKLLVHLEELRCCFDGDASYEPLVNPQDNQKITVRGDADDRDNTQTQRGGLPIFTRSKGSSENLPFPVIGSLNGVRMFSKSYEITLLHSSMEDYSIVWSEFYDSVVLIGIAAGTSKEILQKVLESTFNVMVLIAGFDEIRSQKNIERLKRELRLCYPIVDRLLDCLDCSDSNNKHTSDLIQLAECLLCPENHLIQIALNTYSECVDSMFSCVLIHGRIAVATESWWSLSPDELKLLTLLAGVESSNMNKDIPVFLPQKSPNTAFRFLAITLMSDVQVCCLCGPTPLLEQIEHLASQCFKSIMENLGSAVHCYPRNFPTSMQMDTGILGLLLINTKSGKYMISRSPQQLFGKRTTSGSHRLDILRSFYYQAVLNYLVAKDDKLVINAFDSTKMHDNIFSTLNGCSNVGKETYWCSEYHKCHAIRINDNILCVLYNSSIPTHAVRLVTQKTLKMLISDKLVCW
ncbi:fy [Trypoxylus dichotomus]